MSTITHLVVSVRGLLNRSDRELKKDLRWITNNNGSPYPSVHALRNALMDELCQGRELLKTGECDNHDWERGCLGHEEPLAQKV